jgi:hypothetical protein
MVKSNSRGETVVPNNVRVPTAQTTFFNSGGIMPSAWGEEAMQHSNNGTSGIRSVRGQSQGGVRDFSSSIEDELIMFMRSLPYDEMLTEQVKNILYNKIRSGDSGVIGAYRCYLK